MQLCPETDKKMKTKLGVFDVGGTLSDQSCSSTTPSGCLLKTLRLFLWLLYIFRVTVTDLYTLRPLSHTHIPFPGKPRLVIWLLLPLVPDLSILWWQAKLSICHDYLRGIYPLNSWFCIHGRSPAYFRDICSPIVSVPFRSRLRSADSDDMIVPRTRTAHYGPRSFRVAASQIWNMLPPHLKNSSVSREQFNSSLKTWLFVQAYS